MQLARRFHFWIINHDIFLLLLFCLLLRSIPIRLFVMMFGKQNYGRWWWYWTQRQICVTIIVLCDAVWLEATTTKGEHQTKSKVFWKLRAWACVKRETGNFVVNRTIIISKQSSSAILCRCCETNWGGNLLLNQKQSYLLSFAFIKTTKQSFKMKTLEFKSDLRLHDNPDFNVVASMQTWNNYHPRWDIWRRNAGGINKQMN